MLKIRSIITAAIASSAGLGVLAETAIPEKAPAVQKLAASVEFQMFELDGKVDDILWCGEGNDVMLVKS